MKLLYCRKPDKNKDGVLDTKIFVPSIKNGFFMRGEKGTLKNLMVRVVFWVITFGKAKIFYVNDNSGSLMHTSYVVTPCYKFPFMKKGDFEIGPCFTYPEFRGQGIYVKVLKSICSCLGDENTTFYMIVDENNTASVKGIEKSGFHRCGEVTSSKFLKRYQKKRAM